MTTTMMCERLVLRAEDDGYERVGDQLGALSYSWVGGGLGHLALDRRSNFGGHEQMMIPGGGPRRMCREGMLMSKESVGICLLKCLG